MTAQDHSAAGPRRVGSAPSAITIQGSMDRPARILVVDDLPENREILTGLLEPEGYTVLTAKDGQEGGERPRAHQPALAASPSAIPQITGATVSTMIMPGRAVSAHPAPRTNTT